ncbi:hypothetical protein Glove_74g216 [Diversispora epigaea]|uniref:Uncharacterized protein n=1 Tax=Diversispora epigaea TaxID=1348612 RepID=A0A397J9H2_9GLOM|nr:hypothetical protein Glove_74g216 [Diversispora epigaea]
MPVNYEQDEKQRQQREYDEIIKKINQENEKKFQEFKKEFTENFITNRISELEIDNMINKYDFKKLQKENEQLKLHIKNLVKEISTLKLHVRKLSEGKEDNGININFGNENDNDYLNDKPFEYWKDVETLQQQLYDLFNDENQKENHPKQSKRSNLSEKQNRKKYLTHKYSHSSPSNLYKIHEKTNETNNFMENEKNNYYGYDDNNNGVGMMSLLSGMDTTPPLSPPSSLVSSSSSLILSPSSPTFPQLKFYHRHSTDLSSTNNNEPSINNLSITNNDLEYLNSTSKSTLESISTTASYLHLKTLTSDQSKSPEEIKTQKKYKRYGFLGVNIRQDI